MPKYTKYLESQLIAVEHGLGEYIHDIHKNRGKYDEAYGVEVTDQYLKFLRRCKTHLEDGHYRKLADLVAKENPTLEVPPKLLCFVDFLNMEK